MLEAIPTTALNDQVVWHHGRVTAATPQATGADGWGRWAPRSVRADQAPAIRRMTGRQISAAHAM
jgi:hypothetical protein